VDNIGGKHVPVVVADFSKYEKIIPSDLQAIGYTYDKGTDKWNISDAAADYIFCDQVLDFALPGTLKVILYQQHWLEAPDKEKYVPLFDSPQYLDENLERSARLNFVMVDYAWEEYSLQTGEKIISQIEGR
jgi:(E)-4-hydroxy-3-methylbut-2-enyl-diphosphate synthase